MLKFNRPIIFSGEKVLFLTDEHCRFERSDVIAFFISAAGYCEPARKTIIIYRVKEIENASFQITYRKRMHIYSCE